MDENIFELGAPVMSDVTDEPIGMVVSKVSLENTIEEKISSREGLGESGMIFLINNQGYQITKKLFEEKVDLGTKVETENAKECLEDLEEDDPEAEEEEGEEETGDIRVFKNKSGTKSLALISPYMKLAGVFWAKLERMNYMVF